MNAKQSIDEMNELRGQIAGAWSAMSPELRVLALRSTARDFAADSNLFLVDPTPSTAEVVENQIAAVGAVVEILLHVMIAEIEKTVPTEGEG